MKNTAQKLIGFLSVLLSMVFICPAQDSTWSLKRCIEYAKKNNLSIQTAVIDEQTAKMEADQSKIALLPNVSLSSSYGKSFGRSINPTSNQFENNSYEYAGVSGSTGVTLFSWFQKRYAIRKSELQREAATANLEQLQNDVTLNIIAAYLQVLLAKESVTISEEQLSFSTRNIERTKALLEAGKSNGLDLAQVKTQLMSDSTAYLNAQLRHKQSIIDLEAILNLDFNIPFIVVEERESPSFHVLATPDDIYLTAVGWLPSVKNSALKTAIAQKDLLMAKSKLYPSLSFSYSAGSNYSTSFYEYRPDGQQQLMNFGKQLSNNLSHSFSLGLSIPLFNNWSGRFSVRQSRFSLQQARIHQQEDLLKLKRDIYRAWNDVQTAFHVYQAAKSASELAATGADFAEQRYTLGLISANDLLQTQRDNKIALTNELAAKYDWMFKIKIIQYYVHYGEAD